LVVVVRYFGGTLLGIPGLISAYGDAAKSALLLSGKMQRIQEDFFEISANFEHEQHIHQLLKPYDHRIVDREYLENVKYRISIRRNQAMQFLSKAEEAYLLQVKSV
jgi:putative IMPACT (imprinted ancient) family translation regulator